VLDVVEDEGDELHHLVVGAPGDRLPLLPGPDRTAAAVAAGEQAAGREDDEQEEQRAAADVNAGRETAEATEAAEPATAAALAAAIFDVRALTSWRPLHQRTAQNCS
jgi:hypothetical protein